MLRKQSLLLFLLSFLVIPLTAQASILTFNASTPDENPAFRAAWLASIGIASPENLVDFESGFFSGQNIDDVAGLFPDGLVIRDTSPGSAAIVRSGAGSIGDSNPVGAFSVTHSGLPYLVLDFAASPVDYFGFLDIDHLGVTGIIHFLGGGSQAFSIETTAGAGDSAEFFGVFRNDQPQIVRVEMAASGDGIWGLDNIEYGQTADAVVPEPSVLILLGVGLVCLAAPRSISRFRFPLFISSGEYFEASLKPSSAFRRRDEAGLLRQGEAGHTRSDR
jgi:hypothetical protein